MLELHKDTVYFFKKILQAAPCKTAVVQSFTTNFNEQDRLSTVKETNDVINDILRWTLTEVFVNQQRRIFIICAN